MKRITYIAVAVLTAIISMTSCSWDNDESVNPSSNPERIFAKVVQGRHNKYLNTILSIVMLDRYLSLDGEEREKFISDYYYRESIVYNTSTEKYTVSNQYNHYGPVTLVAKRIGEKSLFEGGAWITDNGEILRHVDGNTLWFSSMTSEEQPQPAYAQQIECQFCEDDLIITEGRKQRSLKVVFSGNGTTSYQDSHYEFDMDYTFDKPLEYRHYFGHDSEVISGQATIRVSDRSGQINDQVTAIYSQHNDIKTTVKHLR